MINTCLLSSKEIKTFSRTSPEGGPKENIPNKPGLNDSTMAFTSTAEKRTSGSPQCNRVGMTITVSEAIPVTISRKEL